MNITELFDGLMKAYSDENLNSITGKLIDLYKNKNYAQIREIANRVSKFVPVEGEKDSRCFAKLIMLYHPDRGAQFRKSIQELYDQKSFKDLNAYAHIFLLDDIESKLVVTIDESVDYNPEYGWDINTNDGFTFSSSDEKDSEDLFEDADYERSFYNLIKIRQYGTVEVEFPPYYLEDFEAFEMASSGLESLDGIEYCIHAKILDVSDNNISDLEKLWNLENLEELYLENNQIGYIDALSSLIKLKMLDISGNQIDDIAPLMDLEALAFVNLIGNPVPYDQIEALRKKGVVVMTEQVRRHNLELE